MLLWKYIRILVENWKDVSVAYILNHNLLGLMLFKENGKNNKYIKTEVHIIYLE